MQVFADYFKSYLQKHKITFSSASKLCGIDRSLLRGYASGRMLPKNEDYVQNIAKALGMETQESEQLCQYYRRSVQGESKYNMNLLLKRVLSGAYFQEMQKRFGQQKWVNETVFRQLPQTAKHFLDAKDAKKYLEYIFEGAGHIRLRLNPEAKACAAVMECIAMYVTNHQECKVSCLMELDSFRGKDDIADIKKLDVLLQLLFLSPKCCVNYYYSWNGKPDEERLNVNYILTEKGMLLFDSEKTHGFFSNQKDMYDYYQRLFEYLIDGCLVFAESRPIQKEREGYLKKEGQGISLLYRTDAKDILIHNHKSNWEVRIVEQGIVHMMNSSLEQ